MKEGGGNLEEAAVAPLSLSLTIESSKINTHRWTDRQTDRHTERERDTHTHTHTHTAD